MKSIVKRSDGSVRVVVVAPKKIKMLVQKQFKDECDVNNIMKKYKTMDNAALARGRGEGIFADFSKIPDLHYALAAVNLANDAMASLPALIRLRFENDPAKLLAFMQDPKNYDEGVKIGLYEPKKETASDLAVNDDDDSTTTTKSAPVKKATSKVPNQKNSTPPQEE